MTNPMKDTIQRRQANIRVHIEGVQSDKWMFNQLKRTTVISVVAIVIWGSGMRKGRWLMTFINS